MKKLTVKTSHSNYDIIIEDNLLDHLSCYIKEVYHKKEVFIITDENVKKLYLTRIIKELEKEYLIKTIIVKPGEESKSIDVYSSVCEKLLELEIRRNHLLIALGGGVIGDLTGFIAGTIYRGINYINIPTTLLSQMDSSIGGKTGIDFAERKNILGVFKQPLRVLIDPITLNTLPEIEYKSGMAELIKHAVIGNKELFNTLKDKPNINENIIFESLTVKKNLVEIDEFDENERMKLNFGHTFGHIVELKYGYKHGYAVAVGMIMAIKYGIDMKLTKKECLEELLYVLRIYDLPTDSADYKEYLSLVKYDKKNLAGTINFILIKEIGNTFIHPVKEVSYESLNNS